ncbi:MAG: outer membrane protein transport protein [Polyangia bacterium]|nr:outer membrane protein transport protein [Polyangia bacterium]
MSVLFLGAALVIGGAGRLRATPLENSRHGGLNRSSTVEPHPASLFRNPAVVGLLEGTHLFLDGTVRLELGRIHRTDIDRSTGVPGPGANLRFESESFAHVTPDFYFAATSDLNTNRVVLGLAVFTPFSELQRFPDPASSQTPAGLEPSRYHRIRSDWFHLFVLPAVAVRIHDRFRLGLGLGYVRSMLRMAFSRDCAIRSCRTGISAPPFESPTAQERVEVSGAEDSFFFNVGVLVRLPSQVDLGLAYRSKVVGVRQDDIRAEGNAEIRRYVETSGGWESIRGRARTEYEIPDSLALGVKWNRQPWDFAWGFEWVRWSVHKDLSFTLTGNAFRAADMANWDLRFKRYRGFQDVFRASFLAGYTFREGLVLSFGGLFESSAVPKRWLAADAVDAHKADLLLSLLWRPHRSVGIHVGYSFTLSPDVRVEKSGFDPRYTTQCVEDQVDILWSEACRLVSQGKGLPTGAGQYWHMVHRLGIGVSYDFW